MPPIAPELVPVLVQFPVVTLVFVAAWFVLKWSDRRHEAELAREEARTLERRRSADADVERLRADHKATLDRLIDECDREKARLRRRIGQLERQLEAIRREKPGGST
jgi:hypothetical protein